jgi:hypothetical protein
MEYSTDTVANNGNCTKAQQTTVRKKRFVKELLIFQTYNVYNLIQQNKVCFKWTLDILEKTNNIVSYCVSTLNKKTKTFKRRDTYDIIINTHVR